LTACAGTLDRAGAVELGLTLASVMGYSMSMDACCSDDTMLLRLLTTAWKPGSCVA